jgi:hypothetical protein
MRTVSDCSNANTCMTAMRNNMCNRNMRNRKSLRCACHEDFTVADFDQAKSEVPALRIGDKEIAKNLYARNRFKFFRINEIRIERERIGFAE